MRYSVLKTLCFGALVSGCGSGANTGEPSDGQTTANTSGGLTGGIGGSAEESRGSPTGSPVTGSADDTGPAGPGGECVLEDNDCTDASQKCMPWSEDADRIPDGARCCALQDNPDLNGERCTVEEYDGSCLDSCEANTMCLVDTPDGLEGFCRPFCDPANLSCDGPDGTCKSFFELVPGALTVPLCMDKCNPLLQDCSPQSWHCIPDSPTAAGQSGFICVPPPPQDPLGMFEPCGLANDCEKGLACISGSRVPGCDSLACCTAYCSLSEGNGPCSALSDNELVCVDWMSPQPAWSDVGVCASPP